MSHLESGFAVTDIATLAKTVKETCPTLEFVAQNEYRTWAADNGRLVGDYPLPSVYQMKLAGMLVKQGINVQERAKELGVNLPEKLIDLEKKPWTLEDQRQLLKDANFKQAYNEINKTIGKDAKYVIRHKTNRTMYEIGLVQHPVRKNEFVMMADFWNQGQGLLREAGVGQHKHVGGKDMWGGILKQNYAVNAAEKTIKEQIAAGNPEYGSYSKVKLPDGTIKLEVQSR